MSGQQGRLADPASSLHVPVLTFGPQGVEELPGLPDDWSHHHLIFSNPGTEEEAIKAGRYDEWLRIVTDPRYIMQQLKRRSPAQGPAADYVARMNEIARAQATRSDASDASRLQDEVRLVKDPRPESQHSELHRDWSMNMGGAGASQTGTVSGTLTAALGQTITIGTLVLTATPTDAQATGTFASEPANSSTLTVTNGSDSIVLTALTSGATNVCTSGASPHTGSFTPSSTLDTNATNLVTLINTANCGAYVGVSASNPTGAEVQITATTSGTGGNSITVKSTSSPNFEIAAWTSTTDLAGGLNATQSGTDFTTSSTASTEAANIAAAINVSGNGSGQGVTATANSQVAGQVIVSDTTVDEGNTIKVSQAMSNFTWGGSTLTGENAAIGDSGFGNGVFPAKYSFSTTSTPTCSDFVAYTTGLAGSSTVPSIVAYNNLYSGASPACGSTGTPTVYWEYNTGGQILTSSVLSGDGTQLAFVQTESSSAYLAILRYSASGATISAPTSESAANYPGCAAPCMTSIEFDGDANDTYSSPYYNYATDTLYVGDAAGKLHQFIHVFGGTSSNPPSEVTSGGWPVTVSSGNGLTSPVYDSVTGNIFVANQSTTAGYLYSVPATGTPTVTTSYQLAVTPGIYDGPLVDSTAKTVYVFVGEDMMGSNSHSPCTASEGSAGACSGIYQLPTDFTGTTKFSEAIMGVGSTGFYYGGSFDNQYYTSEGSDPTTPTGNLYACSYNSSGYPKMMDATISAGAFTNESGGNLGSTGGTFGNGTFVDASNLANPITSAAANCSPVTEIYNANASTPTDWIFLSVTASGNLTACSGACVYSWNVTSTPTLQDTGGTPTQANQGLGATGGTSGIIIDNISTQTGASQIYYGLLGSTACAGNGNGPGLGTGGCAVQAAQSGL